MTFQGATYEPALDEARLTRQLDRVREMALKYHGWFTLSEMCDMLEVVNGGHYSEASVSARLRDLRHEGLIVDRRRRGDGKRGLFEYKCSKPVREAEQLRLLA